MNDIKRLEKVGVGKLIIQFSTPAIVGMMANASYNLVDRIFVGRTVGYLGITGITITFPIVMVIFAFCMLIGIGATALISIRLGEKNKPEAEKILGNAVTLSVGVSIVLSFLIYYFMDALLIAFGGSGAALGFAKDFMHISVFGIIFQTIAFALNNIIRGEGNPRIAMFTMLIGAFINIILDVVFVLWLNWGVKGAALATTIGQLVSAIWVCYYFLGGKSLLKIKRKNLRLDSKILKGIFGIGISAFMMQIAAAFVIIISNNQLMTFGGQAAVATMGILSSVVMIFAMPIFGINQGIQPIIGYNFGAKRFDRVKEALYKGMIFASIICLLGFACTQIFSKQIINLFSSGDANLTDIGSHAIKIYAFMLPIIGFQIIVGAYFQAVGSAIKSLILTLMRQVLVIIPLLIILPKYLGLDGIWTTQPIADSVSGVLALGFLIYEIKRLNGLYKREIAIGE